MILKSFVPSKLEAVGFLCGFVLQFENKCARCSLLRA